ncbi:hypothetical protein [Oceanibaculum pacificum]|uniref:hypothetical protein n=1 Tax=Oceanibaculum pacificum TaxID=580166 RepID=UPI0012EE8BD1|nr:hypothetical protein [Oceanibaculum pacificum]
MSIGKKYTASPDSMPEKTGESKMTNVSPNSTAPIARPFIRTVGQAEKSPELQEKLRGIFSGAIRMD